MTRCRICAAPLDLPEVVVLVPEDVSRLPLCDRVECRHKARWISETLRTAIREISDESDGWPEDRWLDEARRLGLRVDRPLSVVAVEVIYHLADLRAAISRMTDSDGITA